ncbi:hypothetical protein VTO42DRAFT_8110 [Malbranchea cinnamomea]
MRLYCCPRLGTSSFRYRSSVTRVIQFHHALHVDARDRLSSISVWLPTGGIAREPGDSAWEDTNELLIKAGFLRKASTGVFHMLPLGLRVQEKLERLIDKHMRSLGASKLSLSSLSQQSLWEKSGRLTDDSEVFRFITNRRNKRYLLAPTHEEEITGLLEDRMLSHKDVPLRVYQISRKYRDEPRPRQGLLRGREFLMKDLYTFDSNVTNAMRTYNAVKDVYARLFDELKLRYYVAAADSGNMGGNLSHEFHIASSKGEDTVITCPKCSHTFNEEITDGKASSNAQQIADCDSPGSKESQISRDDLGQVLFVSKDRKSLIRAFYPRHLASHRGQHVKTRQVNPHAVSSIIRAYGTELDLGLQVPAEAWESAVTKSVQRKGEEKNKSDQNESTSMDDKFFVVDLVDFRVRGLLDQPPELNLTHGMKPRFIRIDRYSGTNELLDILRYQTGDACPNCGEKGLEVHNTIELGHTFHLGTRYSDVFNVKVAENAGKNKVSVQMGCHGIGVSRMIAAVADVLADSRGLNWPRVMAPFEVAVIPAAGQENDAEKVYDSLTTQLGGQTDVVLDDRDKPLPWKLLDGDLIGYPVLAILGKTWSSTQKVEVQCRRLDNLRTTVSLEELPTFVASLLEKL